MMDHNKVMFHLKTNKMKKINLILIFIITYCLNSQSQDVLTIKKSPQGFNALILNNAQELPDTLLKFAFRVKILDYQIPNDSTVRVVIETPIMILFEEFVYNRNMWSRTIRSGQLISNPNGIILGVPDSKYPLNYTLDMESFKILDDNRVTYKLSTGETKSLDISKIESRNRKWRKKCQNFNSKNQ